MPDSDVLLFFLSAPDIDFLKETDDPWFSAHKPSGSVVKDENGYLIKSMYSKDEPATVLGCTRQVQYCRVTPEPDDQRCEPPRGGRALEFKKVALGNVQADEMAQAIEDMIMENFVPIETTVGVLGSTVLIARSGLQGPTQGKLASNQWQIELENLVSSELATFQGQAIDTVNGPPTAEIAKVWSPFNGSIHKELCRNQVCIEHKVLFWNTLTLAHLENPQYAVSIIQRSRIMFDFDDRISSHSSGNLPGANGPVGLRVYKPEKESKTGL